MRLRPVSVRALAILLAASAPLALGPAAAASEVAAARPANAPVLGTFGVDTAGMDPTVKPGDKLYLAPEERVLIW